MNSLELINKIYKPYRITKLGSSTIIDSMDGKFVVKPKGQKDVKELFEYLKHRDFHYFPGLVDDSRSDVNIYEYVDDVNYPSDQKSVDMIKVVAMLHSKTSYNKEVREDKYKEIYDNLKENLEYYKTDYRQIVDKIEEKIFMSPSEYLFIRNSSKLMNQIGFCEEKLDDWYEKVKDKRETRVSVVHNNLSLDHFLKGQKDALISWDKSSIDSPVLDIYNFYQREALNIEFGSVLKEYLKHANLEECEEELLFILLCMPREIKFNEKEFQSCHEIGLSLDYVFKTEWLVRPYYSVDDTE